MKKKKKNKKAKKSRSEKGVQIPYPVVPSKKEKDRHLVRFLDIFRKHVYVGDGCVEYACLELKDNNDVGKSFFFLSFQSLVLKV